MTILTIMGSLKKEITNESTKAAIPAYHSEPKSVITPGKTRAPKDASGRRSMHFLILFGSFWVKERKYGIVLGIWVTRPDRIMIKSVLLTKDLLIGVNE